MCSCRVPGIKRRCTEKPGGYRYGGPRIREWHPPQGVDLIACSVNDEAYPKAYAGIDGRATVCKSRMCASDAAIMGDYVASNERTGV